MPEFLCDVSTALAVESPGTYDEFEDVVKKAVDKHTPIKTAIRRGNNKPYFHKEMRKTIMKRTRLKILQIRLRLGVTFKNIRHKENLWFR